jgi:hypothetical protein
MLRCDRTNPRELLGQFERLIRLQGKSPYRRSEREEDEIIDLENSIRGWIRQLCGLGSLRMHRKDSGVGEGPGQPSDSSEGI